MGTKPQPGRCPKCSAEMELGFLRNRVEGGNVAVQWVAGAPEFSRFLKLVKVQGKARYQVEVFRCKECGYLEHYARQRALQNSFFGND